MMAPQLTLTSTYIIRYVFILVIAMGELSGFGQVSALQDVVYLQNGSIIRGDIQQHRPGDSLWIQTLDMTVFALSTNEIDSIKQALPPYRKFNLVYHSGEEALTKHPLSRWYQTVQLSGAFKEGLFGPNLENHLHFTWGYRAHRLAQISMGTGLNIYAQALILPTFVQLESLILPGHISPLIQLKIGYGWIGTPFQTYDEIRGGPYGHASIGVWRFNKHSRAGSLLIGFSYQPIFEDYMTVTEGGFDPTTGEFIPGVPVRINGTRILQSIPFQFTWYF